MRRFKARFIVLAFLTLALQPIALPNATGAGRSNVRCFRACQEIRTA